MNHKQNPQFQIIRTTYTIFIILLLLFVARGSFADGIVASKIDALLEDPALEHGIQGIMVKSLSNGNVLYEKNSDTMLLPASNLKLIVTAASLDALGPNYKMRTSLCITGKISKDGMLNGNIILKGGGDPTFCSSDLMALAKELWRRGAKVIKGDIICDDTLFDNVRLGYGWPWDCESYAYSAQISALNLDFNSVIVKVSPAKKPGENAIVRTLPSTKYIKIANNCITSGKASSRKVSIYRTHGRNIINVEGQIPAGNESSLVEDSVSIDNPALFAGTILKEMLSRMDVQVKGSVQRGSIPQNAVRIAYHDSPPLSELVTLMNKQSINLIAECLLKTLGAKIAHKGTSSAGIEVERTFLQKAGIDPSSISIIDGSGLSRTNFITAGGIVKLLEFMQNHTCSQQFLDSLPIAGMDGTLKARMRGTAAERITKAKTGYLRCVGTISGYTQNKNGDPIAFSILMNNHQCSNDKASAIQDAIINAIAESGG